jgi:hypothetical protein
MLELTPRGEELEFHVNLLRHGGARATPSGPN